MLVSDIAQTAEQEGREGEKARGKKHAPNKGGKWEGMTPEGKEETPKGCDEKGPKECDEKGPGAVEAMTSCLAYSQAAGEADRQVRVREVCAQGGSEEQRVSRLQGAETSLHFASQSSP
jgi:hypothetical protein